MQPPPELGGAVRRARGELGLTLEQLSERSGISKSMLSQIERGQVNPTFGVVWNLTQALGLDLSDLLGGASGSARSVITFEPAYSVPERASEDGKCRLRLLSPKRTILPLEWYEVVLGPQGQVRSEPHQRGTYEHLSCLDGRLVVHVGERVLTIDAGDTVRYFADQPHAIVNPDRKDARALLMVALPAQYRSR